VSAASVRAPTRRTIDSANLSDDEDSVQPPSRATRALRGLPEHLLQTYARKLERGRKSKAETAEQRNSQREEQDFGVHGNFAGARKRVG